MKMKKKAVKSSELKIKNKKKEKGGGVEKEREINK